MAVEITSPLFEEYPVTDIDLFLPTGDVKSFTLKDGTDHYDLADTSIIVTFGDTEEVLVFFYRQMSGYSVRKRLHKRKIATKPQDYPSPQAEPQQGRTSQPGPSDVPSTES